MENKELTERQRWKIIHRDQEREQRRMRDKRRRQSMSLEDREKHLARRRRNYQLRRQKGQNAELELHNEHSISSPKSQRHPWNESHSSIAVSGQSVPFDGAVDVGCTKRQEKLNAEKSSGADGAAHKSSNYPRRLRLNDIRQLARSLNSPMNMPHGESFQTGTDAANDIASTNCLQIEDCGSGRSRRVLRLTHLKRLARTLGSTVKENADQIHPSETQGWSHRHDY